jgi:hypothetical protein
MFVRIKRSGPRQYIQVVESYWQDGATKQRVIATLGRLEHLQAQGDIDGLLKSLSRFSKQVKVTKEYSAGHLEARSALRIGPSLVFERLWKETGISSVLHDLLRSRRFKFPVERAVFLSVLNRLFAPGSDRQADRWREDYRIEGAEDLDLHHLYRAMGWLGETRKQIEERLFARRRDLFTKADLVFFDTTSIYFEGLGGESMGQYGHSKDHRPDRRQMVVGAVMDSEGMPISAPMWPGNQADVKTLLPLVEDLKARFGIRQMSVVADRGMVSKQTIHELEKIKPPIGYILSARMRKTNEVKNEVLGRGGRFREVGPDLHVKEVKVGKTRYVVCLNPEEAKWDAHVRMGILKSLRAKLKEGVSGLIGNRGYRRFLKMERNSVTIDEAKVKEDARFDGKWVLRTNLDLPVKEVALRYKELWRVERLFRNVKSLLSTRPIFHHYDATICGHVFVSFLALMLLHELDVRQEQRKAKAEWSDIRRDLDALQEIEVIQNGKPYWLRTPIRKAATAACRAAGVSIPPGVRES